jgi:hypothetical protein
MIKEGKTEEAKEAIPLGTTYPLPQALRIKSKG